MRTMDFFKKIISFSDYNETHKQILLFGIKIKFIKKEIIKKQKELFYYKNNNIDITTIPPANGILRQLQLANLALLEELDHVCKKSGLKYWLDGGTLLGAVRHKGFIPWDDDIDTAMLRPDYEQIIDAFRKFSRNPDIFAGYYQNKACNCMIKVQHRRNPFLFVDIFPWDVYGKRLSVNEQLKKTAEIKSLREKLRAETASDEPAEVTISKFTSVMKNQILLSNPPEPDSDYVWGIDFGHIWNNWFTHKEVLHPLKTIVFEGREFPCLNDPDAFLSRVYGNYMSYPSKFGVGHNMFHNFTPSDIQLFRELANSLTCEVKK